MKAIARVVIVSLVLGNVVWAQGLEYVPDQNRVPGCQRPERIAVEDWNTLNYEQQRDECQKNNTMFDSPLANKAKEERPWLSPKLAVAGLLTSIAGAGLVLHWGEENVHWFGDTYCVSDYGDVDYGSCGGPTQSQIGMIMIGSGVLAMWIGTRAKNVSVSPQISKTHKGASATIRWGAK